MLFFIKWDEFNLWKSRIFTIIRDCLTLYLSWPSKESSYKHFCLLIWLSFVTTEVYFVLIFYGVHTSWFKTSCYYFSFQVISFLSNPSPLFRLETRLPKPKFLSWNQINIIILKMARIGFSKNLSKTQSSAKANIYWSSVGCFFIYLCHSKEWKYCRRLVTKGTLNNV